MADLSNSFLEELDKQGLTHQPVIKEDGRTVIPLGFNLKQYKVRILVFFFDDNNTVAIRCFDFLSVNEDQFPKALVCCNDLNRTKRWVKFYIDDDLDICIEDDAIVDEMTAGQEVLELVMRMVAIADDAYPIMNKAIWS